MRFKIALKYVRNMQAKIKYNRIKFLIYIPNCKAFQVFAKKMMTRDNKIFICSIMNY